MKEAKTRCGSCNELIPPGSPRYRAPDGSCYHDAPTRRCRPKDIEPVGETIEPVTEIAGPVAKDDSVAEGVDSDADDVGHVSDDVGQQGDDDAQQRDDHEDVEDEGNGGKSKGIPEERGIRENGVRESALFFHSIGCSVIPIKPRSKIPDVSRWEQYQKRQSKEEEIQGWFPDGSRRNLGVICGDVSSGLYVLDFDKPEALPYVLGEPPEKVAERTPVTKTQGGNHVFLRSKDGKAPPSRKFRRKDEKGINIDLQGEGRYVVAPPSIHPGGDTYQFIGPCREPSKVDVDKFLIHVADCAEEWPYIETILPHWVEGQRNSLALGLAGFVRKYLGWPVDRCERMVKFICWSKDDEEENGRLLTVQGTYGKDMKDIAVQGEEPFWDDRLFSVMKGLRPKKRARGRTRGKGEPNGKGPTKEEIAFDTAISLMERHDFATMEETEEVYLYREGVWKYGGEAVIKAESETILGEDATNKQIREIIGHVQRSTPVSREKFNPDDSLVNLQNGVLDISEDPPKLLAHSPDFKFTYKLPITYDPDATCPQIEKFFRDVLSEPDVPVMEQWFGYHMLHDYRYHYFFLWHGEGRNGKSKVKGLLETFLGRKNVSNASLQALNEDKFVVAELYGKVANICGDLPKKPIRYTGILKQLCGGDRLIAQRKHKNPFHFTNWAKLTFICNELPATEDDTTAFWERLILIEFPNSFLDTNPDRDENILDKITTPEELSGLLNLALKGLRTLLAQGHFGQTMATEEKRQFYVRASAPEQAFLENCVKLDVEGEVMKEHLYSAYCGYCKEYRLVPKDMGQLTKALKRFAGMNRGQVEEKKKSTPGRPRYWKGISLSCCESEDCPLRVDDPDLDDRVKCHEWENDSQSTLE